MMPRAIAARVAYVPGTGFYADGTGTGNMRLNFSFPPPERIREGVRRLAGVMEQEHRDAPGLRRASAGPGRPARAGRRGRARSRLGMIPAWVRLSRLSAPTAPSTTTPPAPTTCASLVLAGGLSYERDVSLRSGRRVLDALRAVGVEAELRDADVALLPALAADPPDAVVIALHGATGEDGSLRGVLDLCDVPVRRLRRPRLPARLGQAVGQGGAARGGHPHPGLGGAAARPLLRAGRGGRAGPDRRPARAAADGQAGPGRFRAGRRRGPGRRRAARRDGRLLRVRLDGAGRALRPRHGRGRLRGRPRRRAAGAARRWRSCPATASTTTRPATPPA